MSIFRAMNLDTIDWSKITMGDFEDLDPSNKKEVAALDMWQKYKAQKRANRHHHHHHKKVYALPSELPPAAPKFVPAPSHLIVPRPDFQNLNLAKVDWSTIVDEDFDALD